MRLVASGQFCVVLVGHHQIPTVETVLATVGNDITRLPDAVLRRMTEQEAPPTAIDARDLWCWGEHPTSLADA